MPTEAAEAHSDRISVLLCPRSAPHEAALRKAGEKRKRRFVCRASYSVARLVAQLKKRWAACAPLRIAIGGAWDGIRLYKCDEDSHMGWGASSKDILLCDIFNEGCKSPFRLHYGWDTSEVEAKTPKQINNTPDTSPQNDSETTNAHNISVYTARLPQNTDATRYTPDPTCRSPEQTCGHSVQTSETSVTVQARGPSEQARGPSEQSRGPSEQARGPSEQAHGPSEQARGPSEQARGPSEQARGPSEQARGRPQRSRSPVNRIILLRNYPKWNVR
eukprot:218889_1